jgi:hypothetical protein
MHLFHIIGRKDDISTFNKDHHHHHVPPDCGNLRSTPANSTEIDDFERIVNPSYQPFELCHEKITYSNL